jgi:hypothetical protein
MATAHRTPIRRDRTQIGWRLVERVVSRAVGLRCTICNHPARPQIDLAIATGLPERAIAQALPGLAGAVWRHAQAHLTAEMRAALATMLLQRERDTRRILLGEGVGVADALKAIRGPLFGLFLVAVDTGTAARRPRYPAGCTKTWRSC